MRTIGNLTQDDIGKVILGVPGISGWQRHLLLTTVSHEGDTTRLDFRWNDDPSPRNTNRGQFACGVIRPSSTPCEVIDPATETTRAAEAAGSEESKP